MEMARVLIKKKRPHSWRQVSLKKKKKRKQPLKNKYFV